MKNTNSASMATSFKLKSGVSHRPHPKNDGAYTNKQNYLATGFTLQHSSCSPRRGRRRLHHSRRKRRQWDAHVMAAFNNMSCMPTVPSLAITIMLVLTQSIVHKIDEQMMQILIEFKMLAVGNNTSCQLFHDGDKTHQAFTNIHQHSPTATQSICIIQTCKVPVIPNIHS